MSLKSVIDKREIRSFRLRYFTLNLSSFLNEKESFGLFMFCDSLQPKDRQKWSEDFNKRKLQATFISRNILKFVFFSKKWTFIKSLLKGGVLLITSKNVGLKLEKVNNALINKESLNFLLAEKKFFFRLLYWQRFFCRTSLLHQWLKKEEDVLFNKVVYQKAFFVIIKLFHIKLFQISKKTSLFIKS